MRILLMTYGTRGDVEPFIALARGFVKAGQTVRLAAPETYAHLAKDTSVEYIPLPGNPEELSAAMVQQAGDNPLRMIGVMARFVFPLAAEVYGRLRAAAPGSDALVHSFLLTQAGYEIANALGIPDYSAQMFPMFAPTAEFAAPGFPDLPLPGVYRRLTHSLFNRIFRYGGGLLYNRMRRGHPEFPPLTGWPFARKAGRATPLLFGFSEHVVPRPADWPAHASITGYWQMDPPRDEDLPLELKRFLDPDPAPVYIGFGSAVPREINHLAGIAMNALRQTGQRGILAMGESSSVDLPLAENIFRIPSISHRWLFPRMRVVVHHGGAGTTGAGLRSGIPNILIPFTADQPFWASRVRMLGAGPEPIPLRQLTSQRLAASIDTALNDTAMRARCRALGEKIGAEDGVARAIELVIPNSLR